MARIRLKLLFFFNIINTILNITYAKDEKPFPDNFAYSGKPCEQSVYLYNDTKEFVTVVGDYTKNEAQLAFDCKVEAFLPPGFGILSPNGITIECKTVEVKSLGEPEGCAVTIEVNRGAKTVCATKEQLKGKFAPKNSKVEFIVMSKPKARNQFKGGVPTFECKLKLDDDNNAIPYSSNPIDVEKATGFFTVEPCNDEIELDNENDVKTIEGPVQQYEGVSYFDCTKHIKVPENYNLVVRCSKFRFVDYDYNQQCIAFAQIDNGQKVCYPERISGTFKPTAGKVTLRLHSKALNGLRYKVGKPLFDCRLTIETSSTVQGFIWMYSSTGSMSSHYRALRVEDLPKENRRHHDIPKMTKDDYEKAVVSRATPVEGLSACGGHINLEKWGYTFTLEGETVSNTSTVVNYDCDWTFYLPPKARSISKIDALVIKCDKMPISQPSKQKCSAKYTVNNQLSYCNDDQTSQLDGFFTFCDSNVVFRARSSHNNVFDNKKPIFNCTVSAISLIDNHLTLPPNGQKSNTGSAKSNKKEAVKVSLDGRKPTFIFGDSRPNDGPVDIDDEILFEVEPSTNPHLQTFLVLQCNRLNIIKVTEKRCQSYYLVNNKHKVCEGDDVNGIYQPLDNFGGNCLVKLTIKTEGDISFIGDNIPYYQCKAFIYDMTPWSEIVSGTRLLSAISIGDYIAANRKPHDSSVCGIDASIEVSKAGSAPKTIESVSHEVTRDEPKTAGNKAAEKSKTPQKKTIEEPKAASEETTEEHKEASEETTEGPKTASKKTTVNPNTVSKKTTVAVTEETEVTTAEHAETGTHAETEATEKESILKSEDPEADEAYKESAPRRKRDTVDNEESNDHKDSKANENKMDTETKEEASELSGDSTGSFTHYNNLYDKHSSILGSYPDIDSVPIGKLSRIRISELADPRYNVKAIADLTIGQFGAISELGKLGRLGGIKVGQLRKLDVFPHLSFKKFGPIGEIRINQLSKDEKLGLFGRLSFCQLSCLAREKFLERFFIGLVPEILPIDRRLRHKISETLENAEFKGQRHPHSIKLEKAHYAFQLPEIQKIDDLVTLNNVLYGALKSLSEQKILPKDLHSLNNPIGIVDQSVGVSPVKITEELLKRAEHTLEKILKSLERKSNELKSDSEQLEDLCTERLYNLEQVLVDVTDSVLKSLSGGSANPLLKKLHHIELWNVNRLLAGLLGGKSSILGSTIEPTLEAIVKTLGGSLTDLKADAPKVSFSNDRALYLIVRLLGKPHERMCPKNVSQPDITFGPESRPKRSSDYDYEREATEMTVTEPVEEEMILRAEIPDEVSTTCEVVKDDEHYKAIIAGKDGGTLTLAKLYEVSNILVKELNSDNKIKELKLLDRPLLWRISRLSIGFISGILKQFDDDLGPELFKITDQLVKGLDVILPTSSQSLAMGISGTMDSTLIALGVSVSRLLSVFEGRSINDTISPLASLLKIDPNPNGITTPILEAVNSLINNAVNLGPFLLKRLLDSLLHHIKPLLYTIERISPYLASNDLITFIKVCSGALFAIAKTSYSTDLKVLSLLLALNNTMPVGSLSTLAKTEITVGTPLLNLKPSLEIVCGQVSTFSIDFSKLNASLGPMAPILMSKNTTNYLTTDNNSWKGPKLEEISKSDLAQFTKFICTQLEIAISQASNSLLTAKLNMGQISTLVQSVFGFIIGIILANSQSFVDFADQGSNIFYSNKVLSGIDFVAQISKSLSGVTQDLGLAEKSKIGSNSATANFNQESNAKIFKQIDAAFNSIGSGSGGMFAEVGLTAVSLAFGVGTTVDGIANIFYDFGHSKAKTSKNQLIRGTIGAIQNQLGSAPANHIHSFLGTLGEAESMREKIAAKRRTLILNHDKIQMPFKKHGIVVVATDTKNSDIGHFYDEEDLGQETKDVILNEAAQVMLQKEVQNRLLKASKGSQISPITIEVEIPIEGSLRKINVTLSSLTNDHSVNEHSFNEHSFGKYLGPPTDDHSVGHDLSGEYEPKEEQTCIEWRESAVLKLRSYPEVFLPTCLPDGSFSPLQCDDSAGICWCVNDKGQQIDGTVSKVTKPDCYNLNKHKSRDSKDDDLLDNEIDIGSKYVIGPSLQRKEKSAQSQYVSKDYKTSNCLKEQRQRELLSQRRVASALGVFIPECLEDGSYSPVQCDKRTNFCWCVSQCGQEIHNSAVIGNKPTNCKELQKSYAFKTHKPSSLSWTYLWDIVRKWQELSHSRVQSQRRSDPLYKYKPNGVLVRLPKSSGFDNSVMFCAKEPAGPGLPSPYEVWLNIMVAENPVFNKTQYELSPKELNRLALITLPLHNGQTVEVPLVSVIEAFPAAQDLYVKFNGGTDKLEQVLQAMDVDWKLLLATKKSSARTDSIAARPAGVLGSGQLNMASAQKMCFCYMTPNAGSVINAGTFGQTISRSHSGSRFGGFSFSGSAQSPAKSANTSQPSSSGGGDDEEKILRASSDEVEDTPELIEKSEGLKGESGKVMHAVTQAITDLNPVRLMIAVEVDPLLNISGLNLMKVKAPLSLFSTSFIDKLSTKTGLSKDQLGKELGANLDGGDSDAMVSIGGMLKVGHKNHMKLGDYVSLLGIDLTTPMNNYDKYMIQTIKRPVELADTLLNDGLQKTIKKIQSYVTESGGPMNAALRALSKATGKDLVSKTQETINAVKDFSIKKQTKEWDKQLKNATDQLIKKLRLWVDKKFGKNSEIQKFGMKMSAGINSAMKFTNSLVRGNQTEMFIDMIGQTIGPTGRSIVYIVYAPSSTMLNQIFGPLLLIPKILGSESGSLLDKILALPPVIIQTSGSLFKPAMMVAEPMLRLFRFIMTGEHTKSLSAGLDIAAKFGISIWGGAYKPPKDVPKEAPKQKEVPEADIEQDSYKKKIKRNKRDTKKGGEENDMRKLTPDQMAAEAYQGGPPPGGYRLGVQSDGRTNLDDEDFISRVLLAPDFVLKAGGSVFIPFASVLAPTLRSLNTVFFGTDPDVVKRIQEVPHIIRGVGVVGPLADVVSALIPFIKLGLTVQKGKLTAGDIIMQTPGLAKQVTSGTLYGVYKDPMKLIKSMLSWLEGDGGVISQIKIQANGQSPVHSSGAAVEYKIESGFVTNTIGEFFGGWFLQYIQGLGPIASTISALFNGILGNIIDPVKYLDSQPNLRNQPLKNLLNSFDDIPKLYKASADKKMFLISLLGGQDPDPLSEIGFDIEKIILNDINAAFLLTSGTKLLSSEAQKKVEDESKLDLIGIDSTKFFKIDLTAKQFLESGLLDANQNKLNELGIDLFIILNRVMRDSIDDKYKLMMAGISPKIMLKAGIDPSFLMVGGVGAIKESILKELGVDKKSLNSESLKKLGYNTAKLTSKGIDGKRLAIEGIEGYSKISKGDLGLDSDKMFSSVYNGLEPEKLIKGGIDVKKMISSGVNPKLLLTGGLRSYVKNDISKQSLSKIGIDLDKIQSEGININLLLDIGAAVLNPISMIKLGIDPQRSMIGSLSQSGLDTLTGGMDDSMSATLGFVTSVLQIMKGILDKIPAIKDIPVIGPMIYAKDGRFTGVPGFIFYRIIDIDKYGGLLPFSKKLFGGQLTMSEMLQLLNPSRIAQSIANPNGNNTKKIKDTRKPLDDYVQQALVMKHNVPSSGSSSSGKSSKGFLKNFGTEEVENMLKSSQPDDEESDGKLKSAPTEDSSDDKEKKVKVKPVKTRKLAKKVVEKQELVDKEEVKEEEKDKNEEKTDNVQKSESEEGSESQDLMGS